MQIDLYCTDRSLVQIALLYGSSAGRDRCRIDLVDIDSVSGRRRKRISMPVKGRIDAFLCEIDALWERSILYPVRIDLSQRLVRIELEGGNRCLL